MCTYRNALLCRYRPVKAGQRALTVLKKIEKKSKKSEILWDQRYSGSQGACKFSCCLDIPGAHGEEKQ
jgi:hypothetical protein